MCRTRKTHWTIIIYTNTKGISTRKRTLQNTTGIDPSNNEMMGQLHYAWGQLEQKAKDQAEYMASWDEMNPSFTSEQERQERIKQKTDETIISLRYIDDDN